MAWIAGIILLLLMTLMFVDVFGRYLFNKPVLGGVDLGEIMLVTLAFLGVSYSQVKRGHVRVEVIISKIAPRPKAVLESFCLLLSSIMFALISWQMGSRALRIIFTPDTGPISNILKIPLTPFILLVAIGFLILCLVLLIDFICLTTQIADKKISEPALYVEKQEHQVM